MPMSSLQMTRMFGFLSAPSADSEAAAFDTVELGLPAYGFSFFHWSQGLSFIVREFPGLACSQPG